MAAILARRTSVFAAEVALAYGAKLLAMRRAVFNGTAEAVHCSHQLNDGA